MYNVIYVCYSKLQMFLFFLIYLKHFQNFSSSKFVFSANVFDYLLKKLTTVNCSHENNGKIK